MIKVKHPLEECNLQQEKRIASLPPEERRNHELLFSFGNATFLYHQRSKEFNPSLQDFEEWLEGLPENIRKDKVKMGFEACRSHLSFSRYVLEKNDMGMDEFVRQLMGDEEYREYCTI